ncbi:MAG: PaaI family thioesterase [Bradymonadales bacterium]|nr:PaaI family thioesterase [Bradymonadales bacterium]
MKRNASPEPLVPIPEPPDNPLCFACSSKNPDGLKLRFFRQGDCVFTEYQAPSTYSGWGKILHGGFQSLLLDEICSWAYSVLSGKRQFVTRSLNVRFLKPVHVETPLIIRGFLDGIEDQIAHTRGEIVDREGTLLAQATAELRILPPDRFQRFAGG